MPLLHEVVSVAHGLWPLAGAEDWDSPGLAVGRNEAAVSRILLAVDAVHSTVHEAVECGADVLLTHHPLLFRGVTTVAEETYKGHLIAELIRGGVALLSCHTNADVVADGVSDVIAQKLGLTNTSPIAAGASPDVGIGRVGDLIAPEYLGSLARRIATIFPATATGIRVAGEYSLPIKRVALCGGAGDSLLGEPAVRAADVYITSDLRHHPAQESLGLVNGSGSRRPPNNSELHCPVSRF